MATKAPGTLVLIIEKQHASWGLMCSTLPALELRFRRQPHIASARPLVGPSDPCTIVVVCACVELTNGLPLACIPSSGLLRLGWQQLDTHLMGLVHARCIVCAHMHSAGRQPERNQTGDGGRAIKHISDTKIPLRPDHSEINQKWSKYRS
mgnify:CR=1 FL=1